MTVMQPPPGAPGQVVPGTLGFDLQMAQKQIDRILAPVRAGGDPGAVLTASQQLMRLPPHMQNQAWIHALSLVARSTNEGQRRLADENARLKRPPHRIGVLDGVRLDDKEGPIATVRTNDGLMEVSITGDLDMSTLIPGTEVTLTSMNNTVLAARGLPDAAPTCEFDELIEDGRIRCRLGADQTLVLTAGGELLDDERRQSLRGGDLIEYIAETKRAIRIADRSRRTREFEGEVPNLAREDLGGLDEAWATIEENVIGPICHPERYKAYGIEPSRGVLLTGAPGVGKTSLMKAMAHRVMSILGLARDARVLFTVSGNMFLRPYVGEGPGLIRSLARTAEETATEHGFAMILLDDFEYAALHRGLGDQSSPAYSSVTSSLITVMQGIEKNGARVVFVATANRPDLIDAALLRPGRFTTKIHLPRPDFDTCKRILSVYLARVALADGTSCAELTEVVARRVFSTADDNVLLRLRFADGDHEEIFPPRIISGALLEATVRNACLRAIRREESRGAGQWQGVRSEDLLGALEEHLKSAASAITPRNVDKHFLDLPDDRRVVGVDHVFNPQPDQQEVFIK